MYKIALGNDDPKRYMHITGAANALIKAEVAASWTVDGNTKTEFIPAVIKLMEDGDPAVESYLPAQPNLSGEWSGDPTPESVAIDVGYEGERDDMIDAIASAWEDGVSDNFETYCELELRRAIR